MCCASCVLEELRDGVRYVGVHEFVDKFMYIHSVKNTHVKGYSDLCDSSCFGLKPVAKYCASCVISVKKLLPYCETSL